MTSSSLGTFLHGLQDISVFRSSLGLGGCYFSALWLVTLHLIGVLQGLALGRLLFTCTQFLLWFGP